MPTFAEISQGRNIRWVKVSLWWNIWGWSVPETEQGWTKREGIDLEIYVAFLRTIIRIFFGQNLL
jgi:hypothetical protein